VNEHRQTGTHNYGTSTMSETKPKMTPQKSSKTVNGTGRSHEA